MGRAISILIAVKTLAFTEHCSIDCFEAEHSAAYTYGSGHFKVWQFRSWRT